MTRSKSQPAHPPLSRPPPYSSTGRSPVSPVLVGRASQLLHYVTHYSRPKLCGTKTCIKLRLQESGHKLNSHIKISQSNEKRSESNQYIPEPLFLHEKVAASLKHQYQKMGGRVRRASPPPQRLLLLSRVLVSAHHLSRFARRLELHFGLPKFRQNP